MPRNSRDKGNLNSFGRTLIDLCCTYDIHIVNGRLFGDTDGQFTCLANEGYCVVDYHIVSTELFPFFTYFTVEDFDRSDHFPFSATLMFKKQILSQTEQFMIDVVDLSNYDNFKWFEERRNLFMTEFIDKVNCFNYSLLSPDNFNVNVALSIILNLFKSTAVNSHMCRTDNLQNITHSSQPQWWDTELTHSKKDKNICWRKFLKTNHQVDFLSYITSRNKFKALFRRKKLAYQSQKKLP